MGGESNLSQRSSSPLKRRASDLEDPEVASSQKDDVEMVAADQPGPSEVVEGSTNASQAMSVDMLRNEHEVDSASSSTEHGRSTAATTQSDTGKLKRRVNSSIIG